MHQYTLQQSNMAMENHPLIDVFPSYKPPLIGDYVRLPRLIKCHKIIQHHTTSSLKYHSIPIKSHSILSIYQIPNFPWGFSMTIQLHRGNPGYPHWLWKAVIKFRRKLRSFSSLPALPCWAPPSWWTGRFRQIFSPSAGHHFIGFFIDLNGKIAS